VLQFVVDIPESLTGLRTPGNGAGGLVVETPGGMRHGDALQANGSAIETPGMIAAGARTDLKVLLEIFEVIFVEGVVPCALRVDLAVAIFVDGPFFLDLKHIKQRTPIEADAVLVEAPGSKFHGQGENDLVTIFPRAMHDEQVAVSLSLDGITIE
jgi:hypothetical protein